MTQTLAIPQTTTRYLGPGEFRQAKKQIQEDSYLNDAREALSEELFKEHVNFRTKNQIPRSDTTFYLEETFQYLDRAIATTTSQDKYSLKKKDERLGNSNEFNYFIARAYLSLKRAYNEIDKEPIKIKQKRLMDIYVTIDEFISSKLLKFARVGKLFQTVKNERAKAFEEFLIRG